MDGILGDPPVETMREQIKNYFLGSDRVSGLIDEWGDQRVIASWNLLKAQGKVA